MVSNASEDFPDPDKPVKTISVSRGSSMETLRRLCSRAPRITSLSDTAPRLPASRSNDDGVPASIVEPDGAHDRVLTDRERIDRDAPRGHRRLGDADPGEAVEPAVDAVRFHEQPALPVPVVPRRAPQERLRGEDHRPPV